MTLTPEQKDFISKKVAILGSEQAVQAFYNKDDSVSKLARLLARSKYKTGGKK